MPVALVILSCSAACGQVADTTSHLSFRQLAERVLTRPSKLFVVHLNAETEEPGVPVDSGGYLLNRKIEAIRTLDRRQKKLLSGMIRNQDSYLPQGLSKACPFEPSVAVRAAGCSDLLLLFSAGCKKMGIATPKGMLLKTADLSPKGHQIFVRLAGTGAGTRVPE